MLPEMNANNEQYYKLLMYCHSFCFQLYCVNIFTILGFDITAEHVQLDILAPCNSDFACRHASSAYFYVTQQN